MKAVFKWINILFSIGLVFIALGVVYIAIPYFGNQALIVRSGSMSPAIDAGSIVIVRPNNKFISPVASTPIYNTGDIIAFRSENNSKTIITHRIVSVEAGETGVSYKTKGDANKSIDGWVVNEQNVLGKTFFTLPFAGRLLAFTKSNIGFSLLIIVPAVLVILLEIRSIYKEIRKQKRALNLKLPSVANFTSLKVLLPIFLMIFAFGSTSAYLSDSETSTSNSFTAAEIFPGGPGSVVINEIMWMGSQGNSADEWIELRNMTTNTLDLSNWVVENLGSGVNNNIVIPAGKTIAPNGFFLISNDPKSTSIINVDPDVQTSSVSLLNPGEQLRLKTSTISGTLIDVANATSSAWFAGEDPPGQNPKKSMARKTPPGNGTLVGNWFTSSTSANLDLTASESATPKAANGL